ncbi:MAG: hypothetical protein JW910_19675 [Anaerolineae bacterium]|nr:hypothetical protein [Anaerolineae bacterium]
MAVEPKAPSAVAPAAPDETWKRQAYLIGAAIGLVLGLLSAYLFVRAAGETTDQSKPYRVGTGDAMRLTLAVLGLVRQIAELGGKE